MVDWTAPFHLPKMTDDKYETAKDKYNAKEGYKINIPSFDDIIHYKTKKPMSEEEDTLWSGKTDPRTLSADDFTLEEIKRMLPPGGGSPIINHPMNKKERALFDKIMKDRIPKERQKEIKAEKDAKREKYIKSLQSPSPRIVRSAGSILTSLDDAQDAIGTAAAIGLLAGKLLGATGQRLILGPLGLLIGASDILRAINPYSRIKGPLGGGATGKQAKRDLEKTTDKNPFGKEAKAKLAKQIKKFKPGLSQLIEGGQVTDQLFGIGISLGPLMGFVQDVIAGTIRTLKGEKVTWGDPIKETPKYVKPARRNAKSGGVLFGIPWQSDFDDETAAILAASLSIQILTPYIEDENPFDLVPDLASCEIEAPRPIDTLSIEIIEESGMSMDDVCNWPQNGERWISLGELQEKIAPIATANLRHYATKYNGNGLAFTALQNAHDFAFQTLAAIEGADQITYEYSKTERIVIIILMNSWMYPDDITDAQVRKFEEWVYVHEYMRTMPTAKDIWRYAETFCGFKWAISPDAH